MAKVKRTDEELYRMFCQSPASEDRAIRQVYDLGREDQIWNDSSDENVLAWQWCMTARLERERAGRYIADACALERERNALREENDRLRRLVGDSRIQIFGDRD